MCRGEPALQNILIQKIEYDGAEVLRCGHRVRKFPTHIQILEIEFGYNLAVHAFVQIDQVADHAVLVYVAAKRDLQDVIVPVAVRVIALAVGGAVLGVRHVLAMQPVRGREPIAAGEMGFHVLFKPLSFRSRRWIGFSNPSAPGGTCFLLPRIGGVKNRCA